MKTLFHHPYLASERAFLRGVRSTHVKPGTKRFIKNTINRAIRREECIEIEAGYQEWLHEEAYECEDVTAEYEFYEFYRDEDFLKTLDEEYYLTLDEEYYRNYCFSDSFNLRHKVA